MVRGKVVENNSLALLTLALGWRGHLVQEARSERAVGQLRKPGHDVDPGQRKAPVERRDDDLGDVVLRVGPEAARLENLGRVADGLDERPAGLAVDDEVRNPLSGPRNRSAVES